MNLFIKKLLRENLQLADKLYFKTNKISEEGKDIILSITNGDNTTKIISDIYSNVKLHSHFGTKKFINYLKDIHNSLVNYNKNVLPIENFDLYKSKGDELFSLFIERIKCLKKLNKLPKVAIRNLKNDIRLERDYNDFRTLLNDIEYITTHLSLLNNRDNSAKNKIYNKLFKSDITFSRLTQIIDDKKKLIGGNKLTLKAIKEIIDSDDDLQIKYFKNKVMVVEVGSPYAIKKIGCNSLWCFTYDNSNFNHLWKQWHDYSTNEICYVIIDFKQSSDSLDFMHVLVSPLESEETYNTDDFDAHTPLYSMDNENIYNPYGVLYDLVGKDNIDKIFTFDYETEPINETQILLRLGLVY
jgi:hypothetical protein